MTGIFKFFQILLDSILAPLKFLFGIINLTNKMLTILVEIVINVVNIITTLPSWLIAFPTLTIGIIVIYQLLGRESGK